MGSYHRIIIVFVLIVYMVELSTARGDGTVDRITTSAPENSPTTTGDYITFTVTDKTIITLVEEINEDSSPVTPSRQAPTRSTSAPESTNGTTSATQSVTSTMISSKASPPALSQSVPTGSPDTTEEFDTGTTASVGDGAGGDETIQTTRTELTTNGVYVTAGPVRSDLETEGTRQASEMLTSKLAVICSEDISTAQDELPTSTQDGLSSVISADITTVSAVDIINKDATTDAGLMTTTLATTLGKQATTQYAATSETLTTSDPITAAPPATPERATTAMIQTTALPTTPEQPSTIPERATKAIIQTTLPTTSEHLATTAERATTTMIHTTLPTFPEHLTTIERATTAMIQATTPTHPATTVVRATTAMIQATTPTHPATTAQRATTSQASTQRPSTPHPVQTTDDDDDDDNSNQISASELSSEDLANIITLIFPGITRDDWFRLYDVVFREYLSATLTSDELRVRREDIYYIKPSPLEDYGSLYVSLIARSSSARKRSVMPVVPLNETLAALSNMTALTQALGIPLDKAPSIDTELPQFILDTLPGETTEEPLTTRKPPPTIGFLSNPGLFISLVVIATVSTIIIIVGLIYLLCDRRRSRSGEYITNHTPRNSDLELGFDNPVMAENDKTVSNGNHLASIKGELEGDMIVPYDNFTQEELMNYEVEDTHL